MHEKNKKRPEVKALKFLLVVTIATISFLPLYQTPKAEAGWPVIDAGNIAQSTISAVQNTITAGQSILTAFNTYYIQYKEMILDPLVWVSAKNQLSGEMSKIINHANTGGGGGSPKYITDLAQTMLTVSLGAANDFLNAQGTTWQLNLCNEPGYNLQQLKNALANTYNSNNKPFKDKIDCTNITSVISDVGAFVNGDFSKGGMEGWWELTQNSQNNALGSYIAGQEELQKQTADAEFNAWTEFMWGDGYKSTEIEFAAGGLPTSNFGIPGGTSGIKTPGANTLSQVNSAMSSGKETLVTIDEFSELLSGALSTIGIDALTGGSGGGGLKNYTLSNEVIVAVDPSIPPQDQIDTSTGELVPEGTTNLASGKQCWQSGQFKTYECKWAVDEDTGPMVKEQISVTASVLRPWWMVDLGSPKAIDSATIFRATNAPGWDGSLNAKQAVGKYRVFVSDSPFPNDAPTPDLTQFDPLSFPNGWSTPTTGAMAGIPVWASAVRNFPTSGPDSDIPIGITGRYFRIQRTIADGDAPTTKRRLALLEVVLTSGSLPIITLTGSTTINIPAGSTYIDLGATAVDLLDGDITSSIVRTGFPINTAIFGPHTIAYDVQNSNSVPATQVTRTVNVIPPPVINLTGTLNSASQPILTWTTNNPSLGVNSCVASQGWSGAKSSAGGTQTLSSISESKVYTLTCSNALGQLASKTVYLDVAGKPAVTMKVNGADGLAVIPYNSSATITWNSTGAASCFGTWAGGPVLTSGSLNTGPLTTNGSYNIVCTDASGNNASADAVVEVKLEVAACTVSPTTVSTGESTTWESAVPTGGTGSYTYNWSGTDNLSGTSQVLPRSYVKSGLKYGAVTIKSPGSYQFISDLLCPIVTVNP